MCKIELILKKNIDTDAFAIFLNHGIRNIRSNTFVAFSD